MTAILDAVFPSGSVVRRTLGNGLRVVARRKEGCGVVAIVTYVGAGYFDETDEVSGIAHVLEHMYFKGTPRRGVGEIARATKASGGILNAATIYDHTHYYTVLPAGGFEAGLEIQADAYANSLIDAGELSRELEVIIEEAKRKADSPAALATESLFALLHDKHRMRRWRIGHEAGLRTFTREMVAGFYRNFYRPRNTVISIVGDVDAKAAIAAVEEYYGKLADAPVARTPGPAEPKPGGGGLRYQELDGDVQQSELLLGWRTPGLDHPDAPVLDIAATILSSGRGARLYRAVRDRRLASAIRAWNYTPTELGVFVLHATARPERAASALRASWDQVARIREGDVSDAEIERARRLIVSAWLRRLETADGQADHLGSWELFGDWTRGGKYGDAMLAATAADVTGAARRWLSPDDAGVLAYRPTSSVPFAANVDAVREILDGDRPEPVAPVRVPPAPAPAASVPRLSLQSRHGDAQVFRLPSGVPVVAQRVASPIAHVGWFVQGGAVAETDGNAGITSLMTRVALRGTHGRDAKDLAEAIEFAGGAMGGGAGADGFQWTISVPTSRVDDAAELLADVVQSPAFRDDAVESERAVALAEIAAMRDDMYRWPMRIATAAAWQGHPYGRAVLGDESSVGALNAAALRAWHERVATRAAGVLVCVGDADPADLARAVASRFTALRDSTAPPLSAPEWPAKSIERAEPRSKAQSALAMLFPGPSRRDSDRFAAELLCGVASGLGGRFFEALRDRQSLAYAVMVAPIWRGRAGLIAGYIGMSPEKEEAARTGFLREFERLCEEEVTADELARARTYAIGANAIRRESAAAVMADLADAWLHGDSLDEIAHHDTDIGAVTAEAMLRVARASFDPARRVEAIVRGTGKSV